jgi:transposase-like protein
MLHSDPALQEAQRLGLFKRRRIKLAIKVQAVRAYVAGASLRAVSFAYRLVCPFSHEALRQWAQRLSVVFKVAPEKHDNVVVDETSVYLHNRKEIFVWTALDSNTRQVLLTWVTTSRGGMEAWLFFKALGKLCLGDKPFVMVDRGCWYPWPLDKQGWRWKVQRGGPRSLVESYFGSLKWWLGHKCRRPGAWHTKTTLQALAKLHAWQWNQTRLS